MKCSFANGCIAKTMAPVDLDERKRKILGFTLIELLVVIAIIAVLAAILFPVFSNARERAKLSTCTSNLKQLGNAFQMYLHDYDGYYPALYVGNVTGNNWREDWMQMISPYAGIDIGSGQNGWEKIPINSVFFCPRQVNKVSTSKQGYCDAAYYISYGYNKYALGNENYNSHTDFGGKTATYPVSETRISTPEQQLVLVDTWYAHSNVGQQSTGNYSAYGQDLVCFRHNQMANVLYADGHVALGNTQWLYGGHPIAYPWNYFMLNSGWFKYGAGRSWPYGYAPYN
jgi:prepilin-type N-terminal cleavage/methylation domain-containing protein/prepilin-type processing-associated H-X9-DG protein